MSDTEKPGREDEHAHDHADHGSHEDHAASASPATYDMSPTTEDSAASEPVEPHHEAPAEAPVVLAAVTSETRRPVWTEGDTLGDDEDDKRARDGESDDKGAGGETLEIIKTIFFALLIALVLRVLFFQPFTIPSASMEPNLYEGDYIVVSKWSYGYSKHSIPFSPPLFEGRILGQSPERGDIAVFKLPRDDKTDYIKRVIGLPGDRIQMIANRLHINGQPVDDVVVSSDEIADLFGPRAVTRVRETLPGGATFQIQDFGPGGDLDDTAVYEVPAGHYFMMGDNRDNSIDSRVEQSSGVGLVPAENLIGKAEIIMFSWEPGASLFNPVSWFANVRPSRFFTVLH